jgi:hypothetical protein
LLRDMMIRNSNTGEWMLVFQFHYDEEGDEQRALELMQQVADKFPQITSLMYVDNQKGNDTINDLELSLFKGNDHIFELMEDLKFKVGPKSFYQTNTEQAYHLYCVAREFANLTGNELVYDLYTGTGTIANFVAHKAKKVIGIEYVPEAIEDAKVNSKGDSVHSLKTSDDLIRYTSKLGLQASRKWYYTIQMVAQTQFAHGYKSNDKKVYSDFFSPFNLNLSVGMDYSVDWLNHRLMGSAHLAPLAFNWKYVGREDLATRYGLKEGQHGMTDYGSECTFDLSWQVIENLKWKTRLWAYTTYKRAEIEWENTITFQFNRYISSNIFLYPRFDDGAKRKDDQSYWQFKEFMSIGFSYSF